MVIGLGGAVGGALIGATIGSWFLVVDSYAVARTAEGTILVEMEQPLLGSAKPTEVIRRDPAGSIELSVDGREVTYGDRSFQLMFGWGDAAGELAGLRGG